MCVGNGCPVQAVIALTHMRTPNDIRLAEQVAGLDLILGGHDHVYEKHKVGLWIDTAAFCPIFKHYFPGERQVHSEERHRLPPVLQGDAGLFAAPAAGGDRGGGRDQRLQPGPRPRRGAGAGDQSQPGMGSRDPWLTSYWLEQYSGVVDAKMSEQLGELSTVMDGRFSSVRSRAVNELSLSFTMPEEGFCKGILLV